MASTYRPSPSRLSDAFLRKLDAGLALLYGAKVRPFHYAPPLFRLRWRLGIEAVPPHFRSFRTNFLIHGMLSGTAWGVAAWFLVWNQHGSGSVPAAIFASTGFGLLIGYSSASSMRSRVKELGLPTWDSLAQ